MKIRRRESGFSVRGSRLSFRRRRRQIDWKRYRPTLIWAGQIIGVILLAFLIVWSFGFRTTMIGSSMGDTIAESDVVLVNRLSYLISSPSQGDVVAFLPNGNEKSHYYIRRIVACPGDVVQITDGKLYVNDEEYTLGDGDSITVAGLAEDAITLGDDQYFVMGDDPNNSEDSRHSGVGLVSKSDILGKVWLIVSPRSHFGPVD